MGPAILAGLVFRGKRYPRPSWLGKCGNPASVAGFPSAAGTVEKSGLDFSTVPTACHFHSQALDSGPFWLECRPWAQQEVQFLIFQNARQMHIFPDSCGEPIYKTINSDQFSEPLGLILAIHKVLRAEGKERGSVMAELKRIESDGRVGELRQSAKAAQRTQAGDRPRAANVG